METRSGLASSGYSFEVAEYQIKPMATGLDLGSARSAAASGSARPRATRHGVVQPVVERYRARFASQAHAFVVTGGADTTGA